MLSVLAEATRDRHDILTSIIAIQQEIAMADLDLQKVMNLIAERAQELAHATGAVIELVDNQELVYRAATGTASRSLGLRLKIDASFSGRCVRTGTVLRCDDSQIDPLVNREACERVGLRSMIVVPLHFRKRVAGVLKVLSERPQAFDERDSQVLELMAGLLGAAMSHAAAFEAEQALVAERTKALRETDALFRSAFEDTHVPMVLTDIDNRFIRLNAAFARMFGYPSEEMLLLSMQEITHPDDLAASFEGRRALLADERGFFQTEKRYLHKDGSVLWGLTNVSLVRDGTGQPVLYVGQVQDITQRKRAEEAITSYNERLRLLHRIDKALIGGQEPEPIAEEALPLLRDLLGVGRTIINLFDLTTGEVEWLAAAGRKRMHVGPGIRYSIRLMGDLEGLRRGEHQLVDVGKLPASPEVDALLASGVDNYVVVPMIADDELIGALSFGGGRAPISAKQIDIARDVAAQFAIVLRQAKLRKRIQFQARDLENQNQTLTTMIDASPLAIIVVDVPGRVKVWNRAAEQIFGWPVAEVLGQPVPFVPVEKQGEFQHLAAEEMAGQARTAFETCAVCRDGKKVDILLSSAPLYDASGAITGAVRILADITARKRLEEQLRQSQKMEAIGRLAGGVAHDFNNLLTVILGFSEMVKEHFSAGDDARELVEQIHQAGQRASLLTRQLLAFSRKQIVQPAVLNLNNLLLSAEKMFRRLIGEDIELRMIPAADLGAIKADPGQMEQIVMNLVVNARDAMPQGGRLTIETANVFVSEDRTKQNAGLRPGSYVRLTVSDTGCGMDEATKARIFEPFFSTKGEKGTGIGLATVFGIVQQSHGHLEVESRPEAGATFRIYLPMEKQPDSAGQTQTGQRGPLHGTETILLVEDEATVRQLASVVLRRHGYKVIEACNGAEALQQAQQAHETVHLLVADLVMPQMSGRQLVEQLRTLRPETKTLYMSGYADDAIIRHGVQGTRAPFLHKPFSADALARKVREILDEKCQ